MDCDITWGFEHGAEVRMEISSSRNPAFYLASVVTGLTENCFLEISHKM